MATAEEIEPGTITLLITEATGAHFRLPASPVDTVGHVGCGGGAERCERWAAGQLGQQRAARLVFENTKLHDDGITLAELKIEVSKVVLGLAPQDPAEGARLRSEAKVAVLRAALDADVAASGTELQELPSHMMLCEDHRGYEKHMRYFRFTVGERSRGPSARPVRRSWRSWPSSATPCPRWTMASLERRPWVSPSGPAAAHAAPHSPARLMLPRLAPTPPPSR